MSAERLELSTNGLKPDSASPNQCPAILAGVHWTTGIKIHWNFFIFSQRIFEASQYASMSMPEKSILLVGQTKGFGRDTLTRFGIFGN